MDSGRHSRISVYMDSIKIYRWIFCIFGLTAPPALTTGLLAKPQTFTIFIINFLYCLTLCSMVVLVHFLYEDIIKRTGETYNLDTLTKIIGFAQNTGLSIVHIHSISQTFWKLRYYKNMIKMIEQLEYDMKIQHVKISSLNWKLFKVPGCYLLILMSSLVYIIYLLISPSTDAKDKLFVFIFIITMQVKCIECSVYLQVVAAFLEYLLTSLEQLKRDIDNLPGHGKQLPWPLLWQLVNNQMLLNRVWILVRTLGDYFAWPILLIFCHNGIAVLSAVNWAYVRRTSETNPLFPCICFGYILILLTPLFILCSLAEKCFEKYQMIGYSIHSFSSVSADRALIMRIREYSLQMQHQKLLFTCNGFLDINLTSFGKMLLIIMGYMVILIQFQLEDTKEGSALGAQNIFNKPV